MWTRSPASSPLWPLLVTAAASVAVYLNALPNGFVVDDHHQILDNPWVNGTSPLSEVFASGVWDFEGRVSSYYRPLMYVFYRVTFLLSGTKPWAYHLVNVLLHALAAVLVYEVAKCLMASARPQKSPSIGPPLIAALLFGVHPIHTEAVAWAAGITDLAFTLFVLFAYLLYLRSGRGFGWPYATSLVAFFLAMLCKEPAVTFPGVLVVHEVLFEVGPGKWRRIFLRLSPFAVVTAVYLALRAHALGGIAPTTSVVSLPPSAYGLAVLNLAAHYLTKLVLPVGLNFWHQFHPPASPWSVDAIRSVLILGGFGFALVLTSRFSRAAVLAGAVLLVPLLPAFWLPSLNQGIENAFTERYLYLPSVGFVLLLALAFAWSMEQADLWRRLAVVMVGILLLSGAMGTLLRNPVWKDELSLWSDAARKSPSSAVARLNLGFALLHAGRQDEGRREIREARSLSPDLAERMVERGAAYARAGLYKRAVLEWNNALVVDSSSSPAHYNLALLYESRGAAELAIAHYEAALRLDPGHGDAHNNLGVLFAERGSKARAIEHFEAALRLRPEDGDARANLERARRLP